MRGSIEAKFSPVPNGVQPENNTDFEGIEAEIGGDEDILPDEPEAPILPDPPLEIDDVPIVPTSPNPFPITDPGPQRPVRRCPNPGKQRGRLWVNLI